MDGRLPSLHRSPENRRRLPRRRPSPTSTATKVRIVDGKTQVLDGPYAETKEQFGGYFLIEAPDLDAAVSWAARCPAARHGIIEVRPTTNLSGD